ncbi:hypothetical protein DNK57_00495 [Methanothermobacter thermautotrophicus]|uniref:Uncharacterized protein n=1 Tax=Methanothermobacter thermautotrophicus TaxID=145262 RepID=A0A842YMD8_METTF|nr:hypothetical protein [Methanothermobacter thermautotrophicus]MBE2899314.1 hypothetical protein [Methanothermobacter thermautotrophicus]
MFRKPFSYTQYGKTFKGPEMIRKSLNYSGIDKEYSLILRTAVEHLRTVGYDLKINNGKKKLRPGTLKGFVPDIRASNDSDVILVDIACDTPDIRKWRRFAYTDGVRLWIIAPWSSVDSVKTCVEAFSIPAEVYSCNGTMKLKRVL